MTGTIVYPIEEAFEDMLEDGCDVDDIVQVIADEFLDGTGE